MSQIQVSNLTFAYDGSSTNLFENATFHLDTDWKLGLIGRNGKGKTTFLKLLLGQYAYQGKITKSVDLDYFPFSVENQAKMAIEIIGEIAPLAEDWEILKEWNLLQAEVEALYRPFEQLSGGEQVKVLLVSLFLKGNNFLLIDEPTNHLDQETRKSLVTYLKQKKGFVLVSHDRTFLDQVVDHIIAINNTSIEVQKGNFSSWQENKERQDHFEQTQNEKLQKQIKKLENAAKSAENWSNQAEKSKYKTQDTESMIDRGYVGHKSAKMMRKAKVIEDRMEKSIEQKANLLHNVDRQDTLKIIPMESKKNPFVVANQLQIQYNKKEINKPISFEIQKGDRIAITGKNGVGKSSILKLLLGEGISYTGTLQMAGGLSISYVSQSTEELKGNLKTFARENKIDESVFKAMLAKMGFSNQEWNGNIQDMSEGQKKKVLLAKSITQTAHLYIWDEPLNYIDILTRVQIEEAILKYKPTLLLVEHDDMFLQKVATKQIQLEKEDSMKRNENGFIDIEVKPLIKWDKPNGEGCIASDKITKEGWKVGYMYREEPNPNNPDSGWRFLKGDENEEYMNNPANHHVFAINTICNYDPDILPYLDAPIGTAYIRISEHEFREDNGEAPIYFAKQELE